MPARAWPWLVTGFALAFATPCVAQSPTCHNASATADSGAVADSRAKYCPHAEPWLTRTDAIELGGAVAGTFLVAPFDRPISDEFEDPSWQRAHDLRRLAGGVAFFGGDGPFVASAALLGITSAGFAPGLRSFALHNLESIALATVITGLVKGVAGRALPGVATRHEFEFGRGFHDDNGPFVSFPSGHTAAAFAMAATIGGELQRFGFSTNDVAWFAFSGATAVGVARVAQREHWPSDLPMAAFIGAWSGRIVQRHTTDAGVAGSLLRGLSIGLAPNGRTEVGWFSFAASASPR